jgi:hypothetical protein
MFASMKANLDTMFKKGEEIIKQSIEKCWLFVVPGFVLLATGCASNYKATDSQSGTEYYTVEDVLIL